MGRAFWDARLNAGLNARVLVPAPEVIPELCPQGGSGATGSGFSPRLPSVLICLFKVEFSCRRSLRGSSVLPWLESHLLRVVLVLLAPELSRGSVFEKWLFSVSSLSQGEG